MTATTTDEYRRQIERFSHPEESDFVRTVLDLCDRLDNAEADLKRSQKFMEFSETERTHTAVALEECRRQHQEAEARERIWKRRASE